MALSATALSLFASEVVPRLRGGQAIALGVPTIGPSREELETIFDRHVPDASYAGIMTALGFEEARTLDISDYESCDYVRDLNFPVRGLPQFDLVIDNGTAEHCFNVAQAFFNAKALCKVGGVIFHNNPANWFGHGFWSMSPCVYFDFYEANGFTVDVYLRDVSAERWEKLRYQPKLTRVLAARRFVIHAVATRVEDLPDYLPTQRWCMMQHMQGGANGTTVPSAAAGRARYRPESGRLEAWVSRVQDAIEIARRPADETAPGSWRRKVRKLRRDPVQFIKDATASRRLR